MVSTFGMFKLILLLCALAFAAAVSPLEAYGHEESALLETVDISGDGGILKHVIKRGEGAPAKKGAQIAAHYDGKLTDGKAFDSSRKVRCVCVCVCVCVCMRVCMRGDLTSSQFTTLSLLSSLSAALHPPLAHFFYCSAAAPSSLAWAMAR
jgi:hypothetical protein